MTAELQVAVAEPAVDAEVAAVIGGVVAGHPLDPAVSGMVFDLAAGGAEGADALHGLERPGTSPELERLADKRAGRAGGDAVAAEFTVQGFAVHRVDDGGFAAVDNLDGIGAHDLVIDLDTLLAQDAAIGVALENGQS